jgi:copper transport protein
MHPRRPARRVRKALAAAACLALATTPAFSHAVLLTSEPQDGQVLAQSPQSVQLVFNEPVQLTRLQSIRSDGSVLQAQPSSPPTDTITWTPPEALADGGWLLSYSAISTDSHPISGTIRFVVGDGEATFGEVRPQDDTLVEYPRLLLLAGTLLAAGLLFAGLLFRRRTSRIMRATLVAAFAAAVVGSIGVIYSTAEAAGGGPVAVNAALTVLGPGMAAVVVALAAGIACVWFGLRWVPALFGLVALIGLGLSGHIAAAPPTWLSRPVHLVHAAAAAFWLGSLLMLLARSRFAKPSDNDRLAIFSSLAPWMIAALLLCGAALLVMQAGNIDVLVSSEYGVLIGVKVGLVAMLLAVAAYNRWRLTRPVLAGDQRSARRLRAAVSAEVGLFVVILAVTALLGTVLPPRSIAAGGLPPCSVAGPVSRSGTDIGLYVTLTFQSACGGRNRIALTMAWQDGRPVNAQEVMIRLSQPALNVEPFDVYLDGKNDKFALANYELPLAGEWRVETRILLDEYTLRRVVFRIPLAPG